MIVFHTIKYKNFLSAGNNFIEINLDGHKNTLVVGKNGAGKTSFLDALCYVLYNRPYRNINKPQLISSINRKMLVVECEFTIGSHRYKIVRGMKPGIFEIYKNGILISQDAAVRDYQGYLEKSILKMNFKSFCQVVVLGSTSFIPFMQLKPADRREIIEDILDIQVFSRMNILHKEELQTSVNRRNKIDADIFNLNDKIELQNKYIQNLTDTTMEMIEVKTGAIESVSGKIDELQRQIAEANARIKAENETKGDIRTVEKALKKYNTLAAQISKNVRTLKEEAAFYESNSDCPTCKQAIEETFKAAMLERKQARIIECEVGLKQLDDVLKLEYDRMHAINEAQGRINKLGTEIAVNQATINNHQITIKNLHNEIFSLKEKLRENTNITFVSHAEQMQDLLKHKEEEIKRQEVLRYATLILKDNGIKASVIKTYIPIINSYINKYLDEMNFFAKFELDENFRETIKSRYRDEYSYESFSEGEKFRINVAILMAWRAIARMRSSSAANILVFDEIFDSSLDEEGTDEFMKILFSLTNDTNSIIISHKIDQLYDRFDRVIKFEKHQHYSRIIND